MLASLLLTLALALGVMLALWLLGLALRDASLVDIWWGPGFALLAGAALVLSGDPAPRAWLAFALVAVWGLRLGGYLAWRNLGHGEDRRYRAMRRRHGARFPLVSLFTVFGLQGVLQWFVSLPVQVAILAPGGRDLGLLDAAGVALFGIGLFFEAVGDWQLARFKADPASRGRVLDRGLWRYTRHPNYFGDFCVWWGLFVVALATPRGWLTVASPLVMSFLLMRVSGVPLLERSLAERRPGYREYVERTSAFVPWPPSRG